MKSEKIPTRHRTKATTKEQEEIIENIRENRGLKSYLEAKDYYFENQAKCDKVHQMAKATFDGEEIKEVKKETLKEMPDNIENLFTFKKEEKGEKKKKGCMTIAETKLGITMVLSKDDCTKLGFTIEKMTTKEGIVKVRNKLGLTDK
jgi:hypothetical protein